MRTSWYVGSLMLVVAACSSSSSTEPPAATPPPPGGDAGAATTDVDAEAPPPVDYTRFDVPIDGATDDERAIFNDGDDLFELPLHEADGLGPLYTRNSCGGCHASGVRGPGSAEKMAVVEADGVTPSPDQSLLPFGNTVHPLTAGGGKTPILAPSDPSVKTSLRFGPPILGRGYVEAVLDSEIERVAAEQAARADGIHGRPNHVLYASEISADPRFHTHKKGDSVIGRFGLKARIATLDDFTADALQTDMGFTSPLRPAEIPNPDGLTDDAKPGVDVALESVHKRAMYVRLTAIPARKDTGARGPALFAQVKCAACHVPSLKTRADYPIAALANVDAPVYTDVLLHDMGPALADGVVDGEAGSREWRTPPLIGLRFEKAYLHDSRATTIEQAIQMHGGEAAESASLFSALSANDREALLAFVRAL